VFHDFFAKLFPILTTAALALLSIFIQYRFSFRNKRLRLANALLVEICLLHNEQRSQLSNYEIEFCEKAATDEPFLAWYGEGGYTVFNSSGPDLWSLPEECVQSILTFYRMDATLRANVLQGASPNFGKLPSDKRVAHIKEIFRDLNGKYLTAKEDAVLRLTKVTTARRLPW